MGRRKQKVSTGEGKAGQTHWLAEEERSGKRDSREKRRKSDSRLWPESLLDIRRGALTSASLGSLISVFRVMPTNPNTFSCVPVKRISNLCMMKKEAKMGFPRIWNV